MAPRPAPPVAALPADGSTGAPPAGVAARVGAALDDAALGGPAALVVDAATGEDLLARDADRPALPASVTKLLTAVAALHALDPRGAARHARGGRRCGRGRAGGGEGTRR